MNCSVCGFSLGSPGFCPACGHENYPSEINTESLDQVNSEGSEMENLENSKEESSQTSVESLVSGNDSTILLPFGMDDAPSNLGSQKIPYGLDYAPFIRES